MKSIQENWDLAYGTGTRAKDIVDDVLTGDQESAAAYEKAITTAELSQIRHAPRARFRLQLFTPPGPRPVAVASRAALRMMKQATAEDCNEDDLWLRAVRLLDDAGLLTGSGTPPGAC